MVTGVREPRAAKHGTEKTKTRPVPNIQKSPLEKKKMKENRDDPRSRVKRKLFEQDLATNNTPLPWSLSGEAEKYNHSASVPLFEGGNTGNRDRDDFSRFMFHIDPSRKELVLDSSVKRVKPPKPSEPTQNSKYPRKFHPMAYSTPEKKKQKKKEITEVTFIKTTWALRNPGIKVKADRSSRPDKENKQSSDLNLNLCWIRPDDGGREDAR